MWLRKGDSDEKLSGKIIWITGRRSSGKSTLISAIRNRMPNVIALEDHLRCRTKINGKDLNAYQQMIGLAFALAYQGFDVLVPAGCRSRELRAMIRAEIPSSIFVYIAGRGNLCPDYEEPQPDETIIHLDGSLSTEQELQIVMEKIWKINQK